MAATRGNDATTAGRIRGNLPDSDRARDMDGSDAVGGAMGISNRGAMPPAPGPAGTPAPPGPATMVPDGALGLTPTNN